METLQLKRPIRSSRITQRFGESKACVHPNGRISAKVAGRCPNGTRSFYESVGLEGHNGLDNAAIHGEAVVHAATFGGWMKTEKDMSGGIGVDVVSNSPIFVPESHVSKRDAKYLTPATQNGTQGYTSYIKIRYWHLKTPIGWDGKEVTLGTIIGLADNTGASSGDHLHWAPKWCDKDGNSIAKANGYYGAFDPWPFYQHELYAGDTGKMLKLAVEPTKKEKEEMRSQLSLLRFLVLQIREALYRL